MLATRRRQGRLFKRLPWTRQILMHETNMTTFWSLGLPYVLVVISLFVILVVRKCCFNVRNLFAIVPVPCNGLCLAVFIFTFPSPLLLFFFIISVYVLKLSIYLNVYFRFQM